MGYFQNLFGALFNSKNFNHFSKIDGKTDFNLKLSYEQKLRLALSNPALLKVLALQCDMFSLGQVYLYRGDEKLVDKHPILDLLKKPNPFQSQQEFLWEFMFWLMLGESQIYASSKDISKLIGNKLYLLRPYRIEYPTRYEQDQDKIILSSKSEREFFDRLAKYRYNDGTAFEFKLTDLMSVHDLAVKTSRIDALLKVIYNSEASLDSLNINVRYAGKFMVAGKTDPNDVTKLPLTETEKSDIEQKMNDNRPVHAVKSMVDIKRFVEQAGSQKLPETYLQMYFIIGSMYNIPKDVLEAYNSGTYENQEKARGSHISYSLQPKGNLLMDKLINHFNLGNEYKMYMDWEHLPFMQVFADQRAKTEYQKTQSLNNLLKAGVPIESINEFLDTNFIINETGQETTNEEVS